MLKVVYVGNFLHSWCTEVHVTRDAELIPGVVITRLQEPHTNENPAPFLERLEREASDADLLIYQRTWGLPMTTIDLWRRLEARGCQTVSYHLDLYVGLQRASTIADDPFWRTGVVFTADGDAGTTIQLARLGIDHRWLPAACVSDEIVTVDRVPTYDGLIAFVGSRPERYHREWTWRRKLLDGLKVRYGAQFVAFPLRDQRLHGMALNELYQSASVVVGDSLALPGHRDYWSDRVYETVGRGGYLVFPNVPGIEAHFTSGDHLDLYEIGDPAHVIELVDHALAHSAECREIAAKGQAHVAANHTYTDRVREMLKSLELA